jgi:hypothetical protein
MTIFDGHFQPRRISFPPKDIYPTTLAKFAPNAAANSTKSPFAVKGVAALVLELPAADVLLDAEEGGAVPVGTE